MSLSVEDGFKLCYGLVKTSINKNKYVIHAIIKPNKAYYWDSINLILNKSLQF